MSIPGEMTGEEVLDRAGDPETGGGIGPVDAARLLAALRFAWDSLYLMSPHRDGGLLVTRADGSGSFRAADPVDARDAILIDHARRPMVRLEEGALQRRLDFERANPGATWTAPSSLHRVTWDDDDGKPQEEAAPSVDTMLRRLQDRGLT